MKIINIPRRFTRDEWGGTETVLLETCRRLLGAGHEAEIFTPRALCPTPEELISGVPVRRFSYFYPFFGMDAAARRQMDKKGGNLFSFSLMRALNRAKDLDMIHLHTLKRLGGIARKVARRRGIPYVISLHGGHYDVPEEEFADVVAPLKGTVEWGRLLGLWVGSRRVLDDADAILCVGDEERRLTQDKFPEKRVEFLPNGVDTRRFASGDGAGFRRRFNIPGNARVLLTVGRIDPQKNQLAAVQALENLKGEHPDLHLLLIGHVTNARYLEEIRARVEAGGLEESVTIIEGLDGLTGDIVDAYHAADIFMLPSVHEPFGIVILEAWAAGLPVAAARVGGVPAFVEDGENGLLFDPTRPADFTGVLGLLVGDRSLGDRLAPAGRRTVREEYDWTRVTERLIRIYEEVIHEHSLRQ